MVTFLEYLLLVILIGLFVIFLFDMAYNGYSYIFCRKEPTREEILEVIDGQGGFLQVRELSWFYSMKEEKIRHLLLKHGIPICKLTKIDVLDLPLKPFIICAVSDRERVRKEGWSIKRYLLED